MIDTQRPHLGAQCIDAVLQRSTPAIVQDKRKFLSTHPAGHVERTARKGVQTRCHPLQRQIAGLMPVTIVVTLEIVDIEQQQADRDVSRRACSRIVPSCSSRPRRLASPVRGSP